MADDGAMTHKMSAAVAPLPGPCPGAAQIGGSAELVGALTKAAGKRNILTAPAETLPYRTGFRTGGGPVVAVVTPRSLVAFWRSLQACVDFNAVVIVQAANTGLTGGSTPAGDGYDRPVVIISPMAIDGIHLIDEGRQVVCLPGATLYGLEERLKSLNREPHSVIGSSCIGASVMGGVCNNSGGSLIARGPAYTELALYARLDEERRLHLVNHLGIRLTGDPEAVLERLERGAFSETDVLHDAGAASDAGYRDRVRHVDAPTPARFNADPDRLFEASGCAGHLAVFAVRLDTFPKDENPGVFYIGVNDPAELTQLRRKMLAEFEHLPIAAEYMHRDCFDIAARYGKDTFLAIQWFGTARLPALYRLKRIADRLAGGFGLRQGFSDRLLQAFCAMTPDHLPPRMRAFRDRFEHHLILKVPDKGMAATRAYLDATFPSTSGDVFTCTRQEAEKAFLHRFAAAGAAIRYKAMHEDEVEDILALDIALRRNDQDWVETLPPDIAKPLLHRLYYGHFFCHVFHQDYIVRKGVDPIALEHQMWSLLDTRGAEYPAEHNVGHLYPAKPALADFYRRQDPCNAFNPGVGQTSKCLDWA